MTHDSPIMMSAPMVLACLRQVRGEPGGKTVTRRMPTKQWHALERRFLAGEPLRLWVRENFQIVPSTAYRCSEGVQYTVNPSERHDAAIYAAGWDRSIPKWRPSIHMPRWASRLTLLDVTIRRERLGDISEEDAIAEGVYHHPKYSDLWTWQIPGVVNPPARASITITPTGWQRPVHAYVNLWEVLHGNGSWDRDADKEVMVIGFRPVLGNIDQIGGAA